MMNYPHNPSGQVATEEWLRQLCRYCSERDVRLFNDAAYFVLSHGAESLTLSEIAIDFPDFSWAEAFTAQMTSMPHSARQKSPTGKYLVEVAVCSSV